MLGPMTDMTPAPGQRSKPATFLEIMDLWPTTADFARAMDQPRMRVYKWRENKRVDLVHWAAIIAAVERDHAISLTVDDLYAMALAVPDGRTRPDEDASQDAA